MSLSVLLLNNGEDADSIRALFNAKIPNYSISFSTLENTLLNPSKLFEKNYKKNNHEEYDLCIFKGKDAAQTILRRASSSISWEDIKELSAKIDVFIQLHRHLKQYPLTLENWKITKVIHNNKYCLIYKAVDTHKNTVAIKRFNIKTDQLSQDTIDEFLKSLALQCNIKAKGLMEFYEGGISNNAFFLIMEYLPLGSFRKFLDSRSQALPLKHALEWFHEIACALQQLHQAGMIHRDLTIDNIFLRDDGTLALADYGVPRRLLLKVGLVLEDELHGSPHYVSPELIAGEFCSQSADVYSLGIIFYELLTDSRPYQANTPQELLMAHIVEPVPALNGKLSIFQDCLDQMLAKDPDDRFKNMKEVLASFESGCASLDGSKQFKMTPPHF